jgi:acyl-CoA thioester hydrolase
MPSLPPRRICRGDSLSELSTNGDERQSDASLSQTPRSPMPVASTPDRRANPGHRERRARFNRSPVDRWHRGGVRDSNPPPGDWARAHQGRADRLRISKPARREAGRNSSPLMGIRTKPPRPRLRILRTGWDLAGRSSCRHAGFNGSRSAIDRARLIRAPRDTTARGERMAEGSSDRPQRFAVGWGDLDGNNHMGNTAILDRAADTRFQYFALNGFPGERFAAERIGPVILRDELVYRKELRLLDQFTVDHKVVGLSSDGVRFAIENTFRDVHDEVTAIVTSEGLWFDLDERKPRSPPPELDAVQRRMPRAEQFRELPSRNR